jgi:hypothetical protein
MNPFPKNPAKPEEQEMQEQELLEFLKSNPRSDQDAREE